MECLYQPKLTPDHSIVDITGSEAHHARVLRLRPGDTLMISNGAGYRVVARITRMSKDRVECEVLRAAPENLPWQQLVVAPAILHDRHRWEFLVEKATELGATAIAPLIAERSVKRTINESRLRAKLLAALKQAQRAILPEVWTPMTVQQFLETAASRFDALIIADVSGQSPAPITASRIALCVGPEGGWSTTELQHFRTFPAATLWNLGTQRLRAETAAVVALSCLRCLQKR